MLEQTRLTGSGEMRPFWDPISQFGINDHSSCQDS